MSHRPDSRSLPARTSAFVVMAALVAVLLSAAPASAKKDNPEDDGPAGTVSTISDKRIQESSGLALSSRHDDLAYTINDRGTHPMIYAIQVSTGEVVGVTDVSGLDVEDTESIAVDAQGTLWLGDLGDNDHQRDDVSILSFPEPGPGNRSMASANRYGVQFPDGPVDVEGMLVHPTSGEIFLASKNRDGLGTIYRLPALAPGATVMAQDLGVDAPEAVTDATFTHSGDRALLRTNDAVWVYDPTTWQPIGEMATPKLEQGESVAVERGDRTVLLGSEGKQSPLVRVAIPDQPTPLGPTGLRGNDSSVASNTGLAIPVILVAAAMLAGGLVARRRLRV